MRSSSALFFATALALVAATQAASAGFVAATPGPVAAVGAPALLIIGGAFAAVRYLRSRRK